ARSATGGLSSRPSTTSSASWRSRRADSRPRRTPTPTASRGCLSRGRRGGAEEGVPGKLLRPSEDARSVTRGELDEELRRRLFELREQRPTPLRDDKAIVSWNGLLLAALAEAGRRLDRSDFLEAAERLAEFLLGPLADDDGRLHRTYREGQAKNTGFLEDYADVANGLYELHVATGQLRWLEEANRLGRVAGELFCA